MSDGATFSAASLTDCNGSSPSVLLSLSCNIPIASLQAAPFNLPWGSSIYATVSATNIVNTSSDSVSGNGALIITNPDPPNLVFDQPTTST